MTEKRYVSSLVVKHYRAYKNGECKVFPSLIQAKKFSDMIEPFKVYKAIHEEGGIYYESER